MSQTPETLPAQTLGDALPAQMARVRDVVMPAYLEIGEAGALGLYLMRRDLDAAATALAAGDLAGMIAAHEELKGWSL